MRKAICETHKDNERNLIPIEEPIRWVHGWFIIYLVIGWASEARDILLLRDNKKKYLFVCVRAVIAAKRFGGF